MEEEGDDAADVQVVVEDEPTPGPPQAQGNNWGKGFGLGII